VITLYDEDDLEKATPITHAINISLKEVVDDNMNSGESEIVG